ncbi:MAG: hypothetical protein LBH20_00565 [Treponema sp.]|jgi:hypothetical protein|nr:hypothetical protein [Treponema sp.]
MGKPAVRRGHTPAARLQRPDGQCMAVLHFQQGINGGGPFKARPVEPAHWLSDARFGEGFCRTEDKTVQRALNAVRKIALNCVKAHKLKPNSKLPL